MGRVWKILLLTLLGLSVGSVSYGQSLTGSEVRLWAEGKSKEEVLEALIESVQTCEALNELLEKQLANSNGFIQKAETSLGRIETQMINAATSLKSLEGGLEEQARQMERERKENQIEKWVYRILLAGAIACLIAK